MSISKIRRWGETTSIPLYSVIQYFVLKGAVTLQTNL